MDGGGVALAYHRPPLMPAGGHYPVRMVLEDRLAGVVDNNKCMSRQAGGGGHDGGRVVVQPPPTHILHSILSMKVSRHDLGSQSPPGHGYMLPADTCPTWAPPPQYPTPPSSHSSSPGPQVFPPSPQQAPTHSPVPDLPPSPSSRLPPPSVWHDDYREEQPMDLKKRRCSDGDLELAATTEPGEEPMDLSCPKKLRLSSYCSSTAAPPSSPSACCPGSTGGRPSPYSRSGTTSRRPSPPSGAADAASAAAAAASQTHCFRRPAHTNKKLIYDPSDAPSNESILKSILCGHLRSRSPSPTPSSDGSSSSAHFMYSLSSSHGLTRSPHQRVSHLLEKARRLQQQQQQQQQLQQHRQQQQQHAVNNAHLGRTSSPSAAASDHSQPLPDATGSERLTPPSLSPVVARLPRHTEVSLAKKNLLPVSARVSEWLLKGVEFAKALPEFQELPLDDQLSLIVNAWSRLLLLQMAETNFEFAVNPCPVTSHASPCTSPHRPGNTDGADRGHGASGSVPPPAGGSRLRPTVEAVEGITSFLRKCQALEMTSEEINLLKLLSLFNPSYQSMGGSCSYIEKVNAHIRKCLQDACAVLSGRGKLRYSQLLLVLPPLFGVRPKVVEHLFCQHITVNTDMELLLQQMLHKL